MTPAPSLPDRFWRHLGTLPVSVEGGGVVVALSGGLDSVVLLHLLRHTGPRLDSGLIAAHLDHALRPGSGGDASWVRGLCAAWRVPCHTHRLPEPPASESAARDARYAWLEEVREGEGASWILTGHHADDQAETVLFRAVRGTGLRGLRGMAPIRRGARLVRPLLPFWREELEAWAASAGLRHRPDPSNRDRSFARNVLRHDVLPRIESGVAPGARRSLVRLGRLAGRAEAGFRSLLEGVLDEVVREESEDRIVVARSGFLEYHPEVRARVLRELVRRLGSRLDEAGTRAALQFTYSGASGRVSTLSGGVTLARDFDRFVLRREECREAPLSGRSLPERTVTVPAPGSGDELLVTARRAWRVRWGGEAPDPSPPGPGRWSETFGVSRLRFPLLLRGWHAGDRMVLAYGTKKLSRLFGEARIPARERPGRPVLVDGEGRILWVPGVARFAEDEGGGAGETRNGGIRPGAAAHAAHGAHGDPGDGTEGDVLTISVHHADPD